MWEELYWFGNALYTSLWDVYALALVVVRGRSELPSIYTMGVSNAAVVGCLVYYALRAWRC